MAYVIVARWRARPGEAAMIEDILRELVPASRREPGVIQFDAQRAQDDPEDFLLYEQYRDEQAYRDHQQTPHFKALVLDRAVPILARRERTAFVLLDVA